jgi:diaminopimelate epimerase
MVSHSIFPKSFRKYQATGNDFVFFKVGQFPKIDSRFLAAIQSLCDRHKGIGADGVIFVTQKRGQFHWRFFNSDGSETPVCGNATRVVAKFIESAVHKKSQQWKGIWGEFSGKRIGKNCYATSWANRTTGIKDKKVNDELMDLLTGFNDHGLAGVYWVEVGVPHLVLLNHEVWNPETRIGNSSSLRSHPSLGKEGANVTWVSLKTRDSVTFERGVEAETLACGSGAIAAWFGLRQYIRLNRSEEEYRNSSVQTLKFPGGELVVEEDKNGLIWLRGDVVEVFEGNMK